MKRLEKILIGIVSSVALIGGAYLFYRDYKKSIKETEKRLYDEFDYSKITG